MSSETFAAPQDILTLRERHNALKDKKIRAEENLNRSKETLERLKKKAREDYGTDDLEQLRMKLEEMKSDNQRKCVEYQRHLDDIERQLGEVEKQHADAAGKEIQV